MEVSSLHVRVVVFVLVAASSLVVACSDDAPVRSSAVGTSSSGAVGTTSGYPSASSSGGSSSSSSGLVPPPTPADRLDVQNLKSITVGHDVCGKPPGKCLDAQSFRIDFDASTLVHTTCVELAGSADAGPFGGSTKDAETKRSLSKDEIAAIKKALTAVRVSNTPFNGFDGPIDTLEVTYRNGTTGAYSPFAGCGKDRLQMLDEGFDGVWESVRSL